MNGLMGKITDSLIDLIYWLTNGAIGKLIDWLIDWLIDIWIARKIDDWLNNWLIDWLFNYWLIDWSITIYWLINVMIWWLIFFYSWEIILQISSRNVENILISSCVVCYRSDVLKLRFFSNQQPLHSQWFLSYTCLNWSGFFACLTSWGKEFHKSITLCEKKFFLISSLARLILWLALLNQQI